MLYRWSVIAALAAVGCGDPGDLGGPPYEVRDSAGAEIVVNHTPAWQPGQEWRISEDPLVRIGGVSDPNPALLLSRIGDAARLSDGRIVLIERQADEVRWFSEAGRHLATAGGEGQGPGDLRNPQSLVVLPGDTIAVYHDGGTAFSIFGPGSVFLRREPIDIERLLAMGLPGNCPRIVLEDLSLVDCVVDPEFPWISEQRLPAGGPHRRFGRVARFTRDLSTQVDLGLHGGTWAFMIVPEGGRNYPVFNMLAPMSHVAAGGSLPRVVIALNPHYSIEVWTLEGALERIIRRANGLRMPSLEDRLEADEALVDRAARFGIPRETARKAAPPPDSLPAVQGLHLTESGELLVQRTFWGRAATVFEYDVFNAAGRWLGEISLPPRFTIYEVGKDYILGARADELGVPYVELYGLER